MEYKFKNNFDERWILKKHTKSIENLILTAQYLKLNSANISIESREEMYDDFQKSGYYKPRKSIRRKPLDAVTHKNSELRFYMFGYFDKIDKEDRFVFSPLGNLFLRNLENKIKLTKIFTTMLFGLQFPHVGSKPSLNFELYPFRLIFKLLLDARLENKVYHFEIETIVMFEIQMDEQSYEELVNRILASRQLTNLEKTTILMENEFDYVKIVYEWEYYVSKILNEIGIIDFSEYKLLTHLEHKKKANSKSDATRRKASSGYLELTSVAKEILVELFKSYSIFDTPVELDSATQLSTDSVKDIYMFYPKELLVQIGELTDTIENKIIELPRLIEEYSNNPGNATFDLFEDVLEDAFNLFINVEAKKISGAGNTDIECMYIRKPNDENKKFAVDGKSTYTKLPSLNAGRLKHHRGLINADYTIIVTPRYVPSVMYDIKDENIVIIKARTLSEYLYNYIISDYRGIDYKEIDDIVLNNLGKDISGSISDITLTKFG